MTEACEGYRAQAYPDPGTGGKPWTIGYGHTAGVVQGMTCTQKDADIWLAQDIVGAEAVVHGHAGVELTQHQFDALVDFVFNVGAGNFTSSTLLSRLNQGDFAGADAEFKRWVKGGGHVLPGLVKRRELEAVWFNTGD